MLYLIFLFIISTVYSTYAPKADLALARDWDCCQLFRRCYKTKLEIYRIFSAKTGSTSIFFIFHFNFLILKLWFENSCKTRYFYSVSTETCWTAIKEDKACSSKTCSKVMRTIIYAQNNRFFVNFCG